MGGRKDEKTKGGKEGRKDERKEEHEERKKGRKEGRKEGRRSLKEERKKGRGKGQNNSVASTKRPWGAHLLAFGSSSFPINIPPVVATRNPRRLLT
jgi:hypothetical protein